MAPIRSSTSIPSEHSSQQVLVAGDALARDMLVSGIIDALLVSGILVEEAKPSTRSSPARRRHVPSRRSRPSHIRCPLNSFILFRSDCVEELKKRLEGTVKRYDSNKFSVELGRHWKSLSDAQQEPYKILALEEAETHQLLYPGYKYKPNWEKTRRVREKGKKNVKVETVTVAPEATFVPPVYPLGFEPTITLPALIPEAFPSDSPPSQHVPVEHTFQYDFFTGTPRPSTFKDDPQVNFREAVDPNKTFLYSFDSPLDSPVAHVSPFHELEQASLDWGDLGVESPSPFAPVFDANGWFNPYAEWCF